MLDLTVTHSNPDGNPASVNKMFCVFCLKMIIYNDCLVLYQELKLFHYLTVLFGLLPICGIAALARGISNI